MMDTLHTAAAAHPALGQIALLMAGAVALHLKTAKGTNWKTLAIGAGLVAILAALLRF